MVASLKRAKKLTSELIVISQLFSQKLGREFYYQHLPLCIIDAVFSIGIRYSTVQKVVQNFCQYTNWNRYRNQKQFPQTSQQKSVSDLINIYNQFKNDFQNVATTVFKNSCRTIPRKNGMLKAEAVYHFAQTLHRNGIDYFQDLQNRLKTPGFINDLKREIQRIPGLRSGIAFDYFLMLAGNCNSVKPDRMVKRYLAWLYCSSENMADSTAVILMRDLLNRLKNFIPNLTLRQLDYAIWNFQRGTLDFSCSRKVMTLHPHRTGGLLTVQIHSKNQKEVDRCIKKFLTLLKNNRGEISNFKVKGLVFRTCLHGLVKIPQQLFDSEVPILILGDKNSTGFSPSEELSGNFPDSIWTFDVKEEEIISEIEKAIAEQTKEE